MITKRFLSNLAMPGLLGMAMLIVGLTFHYDWNLHIVPYFVFVLTFLYLRFFEEKIPFKNDWKSKTGEGANDLKHLLFSTSIADALGKTTAVSLLIYIQQYLWGSTTFASNIGFVWAFLLANLIGEFLPYWYHRLSHIGETNKVLSTWLWKVHSIHHLPAKLNWYKTNWIHPFNSFINAFAKFALLMFLGFSPEVLFAVFVMHITVAYASHANINANTGWLDYILVTPKIHHFHHSTILKEAENYGTILVVWDLVFGTYYNAVKPVEQVGLIASEKYGVYPQKEDFLGQMLFPFKNIKNRLCCCCAKG
ncbi:MAG: sterol desaturase family protein [Aureispira sp.]|nr:sterol desaturase family protein [Aureispira sp.]